MRFLVAHPFLLAAVVLSSVAAKTVERFELNGFEVGKASTSNARLREQKGEEETMSVDRQAQRVYVSQSSGRFVI